MTVLKQRDSMFIMPFLFMFGFGPAFLGSMVGAFGPIKAFRSRSTGYLAQRRQGLVVYSLRYRCRGWQNGLVWPELR